MLKKELSEGSFAVLGKLGLPHSKRKGWSGGGAGRSDPTGPSGSRSHGSEGSAGALPRSRVGARPAVPGALPRRSRTAGETPLAACVSNAPETLRRRSEFSFNKKARPALDHAARLTARSGPGLIEPGSPGNRFKGIEAVNHLQAPSQRGLANKETPEPLQTLSRPASRWRGAGVHGVAPRDLVPRSRRPTPRCPGAPSSGEAAQLPRPPQSAAGWRGEGAAQRLQPGPAGLAGARGLRPAPRAPGRARQVGEAGTGRSRRGSLWR